MRYVLRSAVATSGTFRDICAVLLGQDYGGALQSVAIGANLTL
jgi:hypothetical protein